MIKQIYKEAVEIINKEAEANAKLLPALAFNTCWRSSSLGSCMRGRFLSRLFAGEVVPSYDDTTNGIFKMGHITEQALVEILRKHPDYVMFTQGEMFDAKLNLKGHFDILLIHKISKKVLLIENKSRNSKAFDFQTKEASIQYQMQAHSYLTMINNFGFTFHYFTDSIDDVLALPELTVYGDLKQAVDNAKIIAQSQLDAFVWAGANNLITPGTNNQYLLNLKIDDCEILYINKDNFQQKEFTVRADNKKLGNAWAYEIQVLNECWKNKVAPPAPKPTDWQSKYCQFCKNGICGKLDNAEVVKAMFDINETRIKQLTK